MKSLEREKEVKREEVEREADILATPNKMKLLAESLKGQKFLLPPYI